jgi:hypothetical protein
MERVLLHTPYSVHTCTYICMEYSLVAIAIAPRTQITNISVPIFSSQWTPQELLESQVPAPSGPTDLYLWVLFCMQPPVRRRVFVDRFRPSEHTRGMHPGNPLIRIPRPLHRIFFALTLSLSPSFSLLSPCPYMDYIRTRASIHTSHTCTMYLGHRTCYLDTDALSKPWPPMFLSRLSLSRESASCTFVVWCTWTRNPKCPLSLNPQLRSSSSCCLSTLAQAKSSRCMRSSHQHATQHPGCPRPPLRPCTVTVPLTWAHGIKPSGPSVRPSVHPSPDRRHRRSPASCPSLSLLLLLLLLPAVVLPAVCGLRSSVSCCHPHSPVRGCAFGTCLDVYTRRPAQPLPRTLPPPPPLSPRPSTTTHPVIAATHHCTCRITHHRHRQQFENDGDAAADSPVPPAMSRALLRRPRAHAAHGDRRDSRRLQPMLIRPKHIAVSSR